MKVSILGSSGFLGSELCRLLQKRNKVQKINLRKIDIFNQKQLNIIFKKLCKNDLIINCATSLRPKTKEDFWINSNLSYFLLKYIKNNKKKCKFIHISTTDVLLKNLKDDYSESKRLAEKLIKNFDCIILRIPFLYKKKFFEKNSSKLIFYKYLNVKLPIYPMFYPGSIYQPLKIQYLANFIIHLAKNRERKGIFNLLGSKKYSTWDIFNKIANIKKKKSIKLRTKILTSYIPSFLIGKKRIMLQFTSTDQTRIKKKLILRS